MNLNIEYEKFTQEVYQELVAADVVKTTNVQHNVKLRGKSGREHQIDVYWEYEIAGVIHRVAIECKNYKRKVPIGAVRDFYGVLGDLNNVAGIMVTIIGYQEGAKEFAAHYGISLKELRRPNQDEGIIGTVETNIYIAKRQCLYLVDENWAASKGFDIQKYKAFLDNFSLSNNNRWAKSSHIPLETTSRRIVNGDGELITTLDALEKELPETPEHYFYSYPLDNAFINTRWGRLKINEVKYVYENEQQTTRISIDACELIKAILKDTINGGINVILKSD